MKRYNVYLPPRTVKEISELPGHMRQRVRRALIGLQDDPCPSNGKLMDYDVGAEQELWRLRLDAWRIVYLLDREWDRVYVLAVRRRPPYQYEDLGELLAETQ